MRFPWSKVHRFVLRAAAYRLTPLAIISFNCRFNNLPYMIGIIDSLNLTLTVEQNLQPPSLFLLSDAVSHGDRLEYLDAASI